MEAPIRYRRLGLALLSLCVAAPLAAQLEPVGAPKGSLRFDLEGSFQSADSRFLNGQEEDYLADFGSPALGSDRIPLLKPADSLVGVILGQPGFRLNLGSEQANGQYTQGRITIGAALGVTKRLTLFAHVPYVRSRVQVHFTGDSTAANAGLNPAHPTLGNGVDQTAAAAFFQSFDVALSTLQSQISGGAYSGSLATLAAEIASRGQQLRSALFALTSDPALASPFIPTATSAAGQQIITRIRALQDTLLNTLGVNAGFSSDPVLAASRLGPQDFTSFVSNPAGPIQAAPLGEALIARMGDMDVGATYTLVDRFDRPGTVGGFRLALSALLRMPTGTRDNPNNLVDVGTGNGRYEVGLTGTADLGAGNWGARLIGGYLFRLATLRVRRVTDPGMPYAGIATLTNVRENAGDILSLSARPFFRLVRNIAIHGTVDYSRTGADQDAYNSPADALPGIPASVLAEGVRSSVAIGGGISYVGRAAHECEPDHRCGWPIEASWNYSTVMTGSGGRVLRFRSTQMEIRWYHRLWR
ncbi:MAG TPA: hypothetical protein VEI47_01130 [Gemmatimonadales bacterium]|nr:hypothetical protein [Gemmatimonadales bacterium]